MQEFDWVGIYGASLPLIDGFQGSAIAKIIKLVIFFSFFSLFLVFFYKKKKNKPGLSDQERKFSSKEILIILSPLFLAVIVFTPVLSKNFGDTYVISGEVISKELFGRYDIPKIKLTIDKANVLDSKGLGQPLEDKLGEREIMTTTELYKYIKPGKRVTLVSMPNDQTFGKITEEGKIFIPLLQEKK